MTDAMTFRQAADKHDFNHFAGAWGYCVYDEGLSSAGRWDLYHCSDYAVSSYSCGMYWVVRR